MWMDTGRLWQALLLGEVEVYDPSGKRVVFPGRYSEVLFSFLALEPGKAHTREALAELLWPMQELTSKRTRLRQELTVLRRLFGIAEEGGLLLATRTSVALAAERLETDLKRFEECALRLGASSDEQAAQTILALYRGPLLLGHDELANGHRREVELAVESALWSQVRHCHEQGSLSEAISGLQQLLVRDALNLEAHAALMRLHQEQGQTAAVWRQYQEAKNAWQEALGSPPPEALTELSRQLVHLQALPTPPTRLPTTAAPPDLQPPKPSRRPIMWLIVPAVLLLVGVVGLLMRVKQPGATSATPRWYYQDRPGPGEKNTQTDTSSEGIAVVAGSDGGLCVVGQVDTVHEDVDSLALFFSAEGKLRKRHRFSGPHHDCDRAFSVAAEGSEAFYVAGESYFPPGFGQAEGWHLMLLKYDQQGNLLWSRFSTELIKSEERGVQVFGDRHGGAYLAGTALRGQSRQAILLHYAPDGTSLWSRTAELPGSESTFAALCVDLQGDAFLAGNVATMGSPNSDWLVAAFSSQGELRWRHAVDGSAHGADRAGAIHVSRMGQVYVTGVLRLAKPEGNALAVSRYASSGELRGTTWDTEALPDLHFESAHLSSNGVRLALTGVFTHPDGKIESRVVLLDDLGNLRWKLPLVAQKPDRSLASPRVQVDAEGAIRVGAYITSEVVFNLKTNGDLLLLQISALGELLLKQRFTSEDGSLKDDQASDFANTFYSTTLNPALFVGQRRQLGKPSALQVVSLNL
ncbi:MAG: BTAD domain-containing putative transcriptional regulator [Armatimonadetes bacterium]|nr:BTAD domain-containing putative transcriptional regulator [Armatimonadota bacterium]